MKNIKLYLFLVISFKATALLGQTIHEDWRTAQDTITLHTYINSIMYDILDNKSTEENQSSDSATIDQYSSHKKISIRHNSNTAPLLVINGYPILKEDIATNLFLKDIAEISYMKNDVAMAIYGTRAYNGVILVTAKKKQFKKIWKKYGK